MNWTRLSRLCLLGLVVMLVWLSFPAARCTLSGMDQTQINAIDDETTEASETDTGRVNEGSTFLDRFFGNIGACFAIHPLSAQEDWKQKVAMGFGIGSIVFGLIAWAMRPRYRAG